VESFKTAWESLLLVANGHDTKRAKHGARVDREKLLQIDLHWHDLRHEGACRLLSDGVDIRTIQLMLGHADIKQTQRYLNITDEELGKAMTGVWEGAVNCALWASKSTRPRSHEQRQNPEGLSPSSRYRLSVICQRPTRCDRDSTRQKLQASTHPYHDGPPGTEPDSTLVRACPFVSVGRGFAASSLVTRR